MSGRQRRRLAAAAAGATGIAAALAVGACGGSDEVPATITTDLPGGVAVAPTGSTSSTPAGAPSTSAAPASPPETTTAVPKAETSTSGGSGGAQGTRVPVTFLLQNATLTPLTVSVPAFLSAQVTINSADSQPHTVTVKVGKGYQLSVPPKGNNTLRVPGQKAGRYMVLVDGKPGGTILWGGEPGP